MPQIINIIKQYYPALTRYAQQIVKNKFAAEDIATQVLEQLWELPSLWQQPEQLRTHLQSATRAECHKWLLHQAIQIRKFTRHSFLNHRSFTAGGSQGGQTVTKNQ
jgi:DNA-directed RNA polymerase specialized sigma24 family protein